ncbi:hypothetical protein TUN199_07743 [Pyrenophora tritici-repentis]|nr:hypothetical protein TUN199_07743 [Pyrenophora tritici-repentis]
MEILKEFCNGLSDDAIEYYHPDPKGYPSHRFKGPYYEEKDSDDEMEDSDDEEEDSEDEEIEEARALQAKYEERAQSIRTSISPDKRVRLGDLRRHWTLFSSQALEAYAAIPKGHYVDEDWTAGELTIQNPDPEEYPLPYDVEFSLTGTEPDSLYMSLNIPKFRSATSVERIGVGDDGRVYQFSVTFLDKYHIDLHAPRSIFPDGITSPDLYYVAIRDFSMADEFDPDDDPTNHEGYEKIHEFWKRLYAEYEANGGVRDISMAKESDYGDNTTKDMSYEELVEYWNNLEAGYAAYCRDHADSDADSEKI